MPPNTSTPPPVSARAGGIYPKFDQSPKALVRQNYGRSGLQYWMPGWIRRDFLSELQGPALMKVYEEMGSNDAYCGAALNAYSMFLRRANWKVDPVVDENKDNGSMEFLDQSMNDMAHSWQTIIATAGKPTLQFGFAPFEKIFKIRQGEQDDDRFSSNYDDGAVSWSNLAFRSPDSIFHWDYDPLDVTRLLGFTQLAAPDWHVQFIPIEKIINLRAEPGRDNPEGRSILRTAWRSWRTKTVMEDLRNIAADRGGAGIPWAEVPANICNAPLVYAANPTDPAAIEALNSYNSLVATMENITQDTQKWVITPQIWDDKTGNPLIKIGFLQPSQGADIIGHITSSIDAEAKAILISTMTEFQALGMGGTGSLALSRDKTDNFTLAVDATLAAFMESINQQAVRQLFRLNPQFEFEKGQPKPRIVYDPIVPISTQDVVAILSLFEKAGWSLEKQVGIRDTIVNNLGLPSYVEEQTQEQLKEHGDSPIQTLLDGKSSLDVLSGGKETA